jgi:hypothetical protein
MSGLRALKVLVDCLAARAGSFLMPKRARDDEAIRRIVREETVKVVRDAIARGELKC